MATEWYYQSMGSEVGPVSSTELAAQARAGRLSPDTLVRRGPSGDWVLAEKVKGLFDARPIPPVATASPAKPPRSSPPPVPPAASMPTVLPPARNGKTPIRLVLILAACFVIGGTGVAGVFVFRWIANRTPAGANDTEFVKNRTGQNAADVAIEDGDFCVSVGDFDRGIVHYTEALRVNPESCQALCGRAFAYERKDDPDKALADYTQATQTDPSNNKALDAWLRLTKWTADWNKQIADWTAMIDRQKNSMIASDPRLRSLTAEAYCHRAVCYQERGFLDKAIADCTSAADIVPGFLPAIVQRGDLHGQSGAWDLALLDYEAVIRISPKLARAIRGRAQALKNQGDLDKALAACNEAVVLEPTSPFGYYLRSQIYERLGKSDLAKADTARAKALASDESRD